MTRNPMTIILGPELWDNDLVALLAGLGHTVKVFNEESTVIISRRAWRVPAGIPKEDLIKHVDMILKQVRALANDENPPEDATSVGASKKPKSSTGRKRKAQGDPAGATVPSGEPGSASDLAAAGKPKRKKGVASDEGTTGETGC